MENLKVDIYRSHMVPSFISLLVPVFSTCVSVNGVKKEWNWKCTQHLCVIRPEFIDYVNSANKGSVYHLNKSLSQSSIPSERHYHNSVYHLNKALSQFSIPSEQVIITIQYTIWTRHYHNSAYHLNKALLQFSMPSEQLIITIYYTIWTRQY